MTLIVPLHPNHFSYPRKLQSLLKPPNLWMKGRWDDTSLCVAIVGARAATRSNQQWAYRLAATLSQANICVLSGGAFGIDTAAHEGALSTNGRTCAVLGTSLERPYPIKNKHLFQAILTSNGCLMSQFSARSRVRKGNFPARNSLIAALSDAVVLIQSPSTSGSRYTSNAAQKFGVPIVTIDGHDDTQDLVSSGAFVINKPEQLLSLLDTELKKFSTEKKFSVPSSECIENHKETSESQSYGILDSLSSQEKTLLQVLDDIPKDLGYLCIRTGFSVSECASLLIPLELEGWCHRMPGERYVVARKFKRS